MTGSMSRHSCMEMLLATSAAGQPVGQAGHLLEAAGDQPGVGRGAGPGHPRDPVRDSSHRSRSPEARLASKRPNVSGCSSMPKTPPA